MNMKTRRRMFESLSSFEPLYIYQSGDTDFKNCTHRSETYEGLIPGTVYDVCSIAFGEECFEIENSAHQNATNRIYYLYLDVTRYKKIIVEGYNPNTSSDLGESRVGVFSSDGLKERDFTEETSKKIGWSFSEPNRYEFDVENLKETRVLAFCNTSRYAEPKIYEIRME